MNELISSITTL